MSYSYVICDSIESTNLADWREVQRDAGDAFFDPRFIASVERAMPLEGRYWTLIIYDDEQRPVAIACLSMLCVDAALLAGPKTAWLVDVIRRIWPRYLHFNMLLAGLPVSASQRPIHIRGGTECRRVVEALDRAICGLAKQQRSAVIVLKDFTPEEAEQIAHVSECGYRRADTLPVSQFPPDFDSLEDVLQAMKSRYRVKMQKSLRKYEAAGLRTVFTTGAEGAAELYSAELHKLYLALMDRVPKEMERLPAEFFRELARQFGSQVIMTTIYRVEKPIAVGWSLRTDNRLDILFGGVDYGENVATDAYFNVVYQQLDYALRQGVSEIHVGANANEFKSRIGCFQRPRYVFVKGRHVVRALLPLVFPLFFGPVELYEPTGVFREVPQEAAISPS